jgi:hypothetical protein
VKALYGLYPDGRSAQQVFNRLRAIGLTPGQITVISAQPMDDYEFGRIDKHTWMWRLAAGGGILGMAAAFGLAWIAETSWPINTGGLPIFAWWPNLIIVFELTMLGAIVTTVVTLVVSAGLGWRAALYDPEVSDGKILVGVENPSADSVREVEAALSAPPGAHVRTIGS